MQLLNAYLIGMAVVGLLAVAFCHRRVRSSRGRPAQDAPARQRPARPAKVARAQAEAPRRRPAPTRADAPAVGPVDPALAWVRAEFGRLVDEMPVNVRSDARAALGRLERGEKGTMQDDSVLFRLFMNAQSSDEQRLAAALAAG